MRLLKFVLIGLLVAVALTAGLIVTAIVGVGAAVVLIARRLLRSASRPTPAAPRHIQRRDASEVIEISATEVPLDRRT